MLCAGSVAIAQELPFRTLERQLLPGALQVELDREGHARVTRQGKVLLQLELLQSTARGWRRAEGESSLWQRHFDYFHLDGVWFWQRTPEADTPIAPGFRLRGEGVRFVEEEIHAHSSVGASFSQRLRFAQLALADGSWLAVFDPSGAPLVHAPSEDVAILGAPRTPAWRLAIATAPSRETLHYDLGQALLAVRPLADLTQLQPPPLCERCRHPRLAELRVHAWRDGAALHLELSLPNAGGDPFHDRPVFETLQLLGRPLGFALREHSIASAHYLLPAHSALTEPTWQDLARGENRLQLLASSGEPVQFEQVELDVELPATTALHAPAAELPPLLSPQLLSASPNPFSGATWLRVVIPATIEEAFDLDEQQLARVDGKAPFAPGAQVRVRVYNVKGKLVRTLFEGIAEPGELALDWNGQDEAGEVVATGAYYVNLQIDEYGVTRRVTMLGN